MSCFKNMFLYNVSCIFNNIILPLIIAPSAFINLVTCDLTFTALRLVVLHFSGNSYTNKILEFLPNFNIFHLYIVHCY